MSLRNEPNLLAACHAVNVHKPLPQFLNITSAQLRYCIRNRVVVALRYQNGAIGSRLSCQTKSFQLLNECYSITGLILMLVFASEADHDKVLK